MDNKEITRYNLKYNGVLCIGVKWCYSEPDVFYFMRNGKKYKFMLTKKFGAVSDIDLIRGVIKEFFLPWLEKNS